MNEVSTTDELTGLHNRKYLQEALEAEISRSRRYKTKVSCILFDLDNTLSPEYVHKPTKRLKKLAETLNIVIIIVCQLTRDTEGKEPLLNSLRGSGSIEQDSNIQKSK